ncbi:MAG: hypothetical protein NUW37_12605 [Planctomycetes bacterium]|nr:hypothetical protein [Planctomycetota bacterium]
MLETLVRRLKHRSYRRFPPQILKKPTIRLRPAGSTKDTAMALITFRRYDCGMTKVGNHRIVSLLPAATDIVVALGAAELLAGVSHLCKLPDGFENVPRVLGTTIDSEKWDMERINAEVRRRSEAREPLYFMDDDAITALEPTLIITQGLCPVCAATPEDLSAEVRANCPLLLTLTPHSLADVARDIESVGRAIGLLEKGREVASEFRARIEKVRAKYPVNQEPSEGTSGDFRVQGHPRPQDFRKPRVAVIEWFSSLWISGEWIAEMVEVCGCESAPLAPGESSREATWEELRAAEVDAIVLAPCSMDVSRTERELPLLEKQRGWRELPAVKAGRVALLAGDAYFSAPGPRLADGVEALAEAIDSLLG